MTENNEKPIPIIDLFAGPGGLGEGFTSVTGKNNNRHFKIALSIEKDDFAHRTLTLRSFVRQFEQNKLPPEYYSFLRGEIVEEELYNLYPQEAEQAKDEAWKIELGEKTSHSLIDTRIKAALKGEAKFILIGGPPCQAYSLVGRARRQEKEGLDIEDERVYLYREYYRILAVHNPPVFVMENVKGLLSSKVNNEFIFKQLIKDLQNPLGSYKKLEGREDLEYKCPGYKIYSLVKGLGADLFGEDLFEPKDFIVRTEEYGIPQTRHRIILLGIRKDLNAIPDILRKHKEQISLEKVINGLPKLRSGLSKSVDNKYAWKKVIRSILKTKLKNEVDELVWAKMKEVIEKIRIPQKDRGGSFIKYATKIKYKNIWFLDKNIEGVCNHETRSHIELDIHRYLFVSCFAKVYNRSPKLSDFPISLWPKHLNIAMGIGENKFADRFRVQLPAFFMPLFVASQPSSIVFPALSQKFPDLSITSPSLITTTSLSLLTSPFLLTTIPLSSVTSLSDSTQSPFLYTISFSFL
jgi:DNA (cytosine-5)-methyltransferase 1